jgi:hypothetical protein
MPPLASDLRRQLENVCTQARELAEAAARAALQKRAVDSAEPFGHFTAAAKKLRNRLRARGRQLGDLRSSNKTQTIDQLTQELAYEYWHRMLFARFLAENNLLMHPDGVSVSLADCEELAKAEGAANGFELAARYASRMLPQIFRTGDVLLEVEFPLNDRLPLEKLLATLPPATFTAADGLGWVYQFWQSKKKEEVNKSGKKIDGQSLPAVTQLFTEHYMVEFLLDNTLGARWRAHRNQPDDHRSHHAPRDVSVSPHHAPRDGLHHAERDDYGAPVAFDYLRWRDDGTPAAGTFEGWPKTLAEFTLLDPCCGSGHFLVAAFNKLVPLRMREEGLTAAQACDAVLHDNLFGLEIDPRCTQIAAFALALAAWKFPGEDGQPLGHRALPPLNIACTGIGPAASQAEWLKLAELAFDQRHRSHHAPLKQPQDHRSHHAPRDVPVSEHPAPRDENHHATQRVPGDDYGRRLKVLGREPVLAGLRHLYALFSEAATLGSLIDPGQLAEDLITADYETLKPYLEAALTAEAGDDDAHEHAVAAAGMVKAAELLAGEYTLVMTNVPYLGRGKQGDVLKQHLERFFPLGKADLATAFVLRCLDLAETGGTAATVTPQNWLFLTSYKKLREYLLEKATWNAVARLGPHAFDTITGEVVNVALAVISAVQPDAERKFAGCDVTELMTAAEKAEALHSDSALRMLRQNDQLANPGAVVATEPLSAHALLSGYARSVEGLSTGDGERYAACFWEVADSTVWERFQASPDAVAHYGGQHRVVRWEGGNGSLCSSEGARIQGQSAWNKRGVLVGEMNTIPCCIYNGYIHDKITAAVVPDDPSHLPAMWCYLSSPNYRADLRRINQKMFVVTGTLLQVPFDLAHWQAVAAEKYPDGLPEPHSDDPTQWLFKGEIATSTQPLQVAVARLVGYRWPQQSDSHDALDALADRDGIVCLSSVRGEPSAADRLAEILRVSHRRHHAPRDESRARPATSGAESNGERKSADTHHAERDDCNTTHHAERDDYGSLSVRNAERDDYGGTAEIQAVHQLLAAVGCKPGTTLDDWLRNSFFEQHCKLFHQRPFIWHIWDGRKDGFSALVNYHKLDHQALEKLTYSYLQDWITAQAAGARQNKTGADLRLKFAQELQHKLKLILAGEPPYDIFVRWKPLAEQPIGWQPDLNDGVRMNIRPFVEADVLRKKPNIKWTKDRGKEPQRPQQEYPWFWKDGEPIGDRVNDIHLTLAEKDYRRHHAPRDGSSRGA